MTDQDQTSPFKTGGGMDALRELGRDRPDALIGRVLGDYRITGLIAEGGMGRVYHAERIDGIFERKVAIKLNAGSGLSSDLKERFLREQSILAGLNHPNISQLYDAGITDDGLPFFVMDYVEGLPIDEYCNSHRLSIKARLELVLDVTRAIQFAHRNLVIHRDIKPSNVLVDESGRVRVLDFGIAKMLKPDVESAQLTQESRRPATPAFASPEMLRGEPVDATTDVYAMGVLLYLLLTGRLPLDFEGLTLSETLKRASDAMPEPLSKRNPKLAGDLEAIVTKALEKDPAERYASVESFAADIRNHLDGLPVTARAPSALYRAGKFVARHRTGVAFSAFAVIALISIAGLSVRSAIVAEQQAEQIALERDRAEQTTEFLISIFHAADPNIVPGEQTAREILEAGRARIEADLAEQPDVQADLLQAMGSVYRNWRLDTEGLSVLQRELELREFTEGVHSDTYADALIRLAYMTDIAGDYDSSIDYATRALDIYVANENGAGRSEALERIGRIHHLRGEYDDARLHFEQALVSVIERTGPESLEAAAVREHLANLSNHQGRYEESLAEFEEVLRIHNMHVTGDNSATSTKYLGIGNVLVKLSRYAEAKDAFETGLAMNERLFGPDNSYTMYFVNGLGKAAEGSGDYDSAANWFGEATRLADRDMPGSANFGFAISNAGRVDMLRGEYESALDSLRTALQVFENTLPTHWVLGEVKWRLGACLVETGNYAEAEPLILAGIDIVEKQWGPDHNNTLDAQAAATRLYAAWGNQTAAE